MVKLHFPQVAGFKHKLVALGHPALARVVGSPVDLEQEPPADLHTDMDTRKNGKSIPLGKKTLLSYCLSLDGWHCSVLEEQQWMRMKQTSQGTRPV